MPLTISIITINFNNAIGLEKTIASVANQSYGDIEYLVIDGGSSDNSPAIIQNYQTKINYFVSEKDNGIYHAMNKGIKKAKGDYLLFLNSGDILSANDIIEKALSFGADTDLIIGNLILINNGVKRNWVPDEKLTFSLFYFTGIPHPSTFIKKELFNTVGLYDESLSIASDWKFFLLAVCKFSCSYKRINLAIAEFEENGISSNPLNIQKILAEREEVIRVDFSAFLPDYEELWAAKKQLRKLRYTIKIKKFLGIR